MYNQTTSMSFWLMNLSDGLGANSIIMTGAASVQKAAYDNWQMAAKTQFSILDKQNKLVLDCANRQDKLFKDWEKYVAPPSGG